MALNAYRRKMSWRKRLDLRFQKWIKKPEFYNVYSLLKSVGYDPEGSGNQGSVDDSKIPVLPKNHNPQKDEPEAIRSLFKRTFRKHARDEWDECEWRLHRYVYAKLTEKVDSQIGQVLSALDNGPHSEDTVVVFTSDHGDYDASHKLEHKTAFYKEAVNIPLIVSGSDTFPKGTVSSQLVSNGLDLLPTLCALAGADPPQGLWGKNIAQIIKDQPAIEREWIPVESEIGRALWNDSWAYVVYDCGEHREQLYDLKNDPGQTRNHIKKNPEILERCRSLIREFWPSLDVPH